MQIFKYCSVRLCVQSETLYSKLVCLLVIGMTYCASIQVCVPCSSLKKKKQTHIKVKDEKISILCDIFKKTFFFLWKIYLTSLTLYWENFTSGIGSSVGKESDCNAGDPGSIPGSERSPRERNGYALQHSCLENPMDTGAWRATVCGVTKEGLTLWLSLNIRFTGFHFAPAVYLFNLCLIAEMVHFGCFFFFLCLFLNINLFYTSIVWKILADKGI